MTPSNRIYALNQVLEVIDHTLMEPLTAESLARGLGYSRSALDRLFVELLGDTPTRHIRNRRMRAAAYQLIHTRKRIVDIALDYHFDSQEAFTRAFQRAFGLPPAEYRRRNTFAPLYPIVSLRAHDLQPARSRVITTWQPYRA